MLTLRGVPALRDFKKQKLLSELKARNPRVSSLDAEWIYYVDSGLPLAETSQALIAALLNDGTPGERLPLGQRLWVVPRPGTISPWSSKATDILKACGLEQVRRVERGLVVYVLSDGGALPEAELLRLGPALIDRMTQALFATEGEASRLFEEAKPASLSRVPLSSDEAALERANRELGLALSHEEMAYLTERYRELRRNPTDVELMMFAQANSEHCRHKIFGGDWIVDGERQTHSLFSMIRNTYAATPQGVLSAYKDNAAVLEGFSVQRFFPHPATREYGATAEEAHIMIKVETHNHPTAISPFPGASTGSGGEIRDEGATGRGAKPKAGLVGFSVSNLRIPGFEQAWEAGGAGKPDRIASALEIMLEAPLGGAAFNNEFGRPALLGYFRSYEQLAPGVGGESVRGYHKPIMVAGGLGNIRPMHVEKAPIQSGARLVVLGGPALLIGLGGGAASSMASGASEADLDYASVQRDNPEMQRRCQEVIDACNALGDASPIVSIHDVGAGGLSNAMPELVYEFGKGAQIDLRKIPNLEPGMSPMQIWSNEAQERYVLAIDEERLDRFAEIAERERCPFAVVGSATETPALIVEDPKFGDTPIDLPLSVLFGLPPKMVRSFERQTVTHRALGLDGIELAEAIKRVLQVPSVADKSFLITIGDRSVTGLVARDQMIGPWQVPVADAGLTLSDFQGYQGEAMAIGERTPVAIIDSAAAARMAVGEALTNLMSAYVESLERIKLSANWMAAAGHPGEDQALFDAVRAVGMELCPTLGLTIPVGKDSMSMKTVWDGGRKVVVSPLSLIVTAFARVPDVRRALTPELRRDKGRSELLLIDLGLGRCRLGGSALAQAYSQVGDSAPDLDDPELFRAFFSGLKALRDQDLVLAYHDRSDGGLLACLCEMAFASGQGISVELARLGPTPLSALFNEELGAVLQVESANITTVLQVLRDHGLGDASFVLGRPTSEPQLELKWHGSALFSQSVSSLRGYWSETSFRMQALRDNPTCAEQEQALRVDASNRGLSATLSFSVSPAPASSGARPRVAILREQGVNGQVEMAAAFERAGFSALDVHMSDLVSGRRTLDEFQGVAMCGGFSYGDVLGAGRGWANAALHNSAAREALERFFQRSETFALGVCNGCQALARLKDIIVGAEHFPRFVRNESEQFEARLSMVEVLESPSVLFRGMAGSLLPIVVSHGEGAADFQEQSPSDVLNAGLVSLRYVDHQGQPTQHYPENPNGSPLGITSVCSRDGRVTIMMPHPERVFRSVQLSWHPREFSEDSPWMQLFYNARRFVG